jgi:hypothetical protein
MVFEPRSEGFAEMIPTFKLGQKVKIKYQPFEDRCPDCGHMPTQPPFEAVARITKLSPLISRCPVCLRDRVHVQGWYGTDFRQNGYFVAFPYTLIFPFSKSEAKEAPGNRLKPERGLASNQSV